MALYVSSLTRPSLALQQTTLSVTIEAESEVEGRFANPVREVMQADRKVIAVEIRTILID